MGHGVETPGFDDKQKVLQHHTSRCCSLKSDIYDYYGQHTSLISMEEST